MSMALGNSHIEEVAASLVREYLSRKGLKTTLQVMDEEMPRSGGSISNRQALMKEVKIEKLMKKNKDSEDPLRTMIEVMSRHFIERSVTARDSPNLGFPVTDSPSPTSQLTKSVMSPASSSKPFTNTNTSVMMPKTRPSTSQVRTRIGADNSDIVVEDDIESETVLGGGMSGIFTSQLVDTEPSPKTYQRQGRPLSSKMRPMSGTILSNLDNTNRKRNSKPQLSVNSQNQQKFKISDPKPLNAGLGERNDRPTSEFGDAKTSLQGTSALKTSNNFGMNNGVMSESKTAQKKTSIEEVLERSSEKLDQISRRKSQSEEERTRKGYSVDMSSMSKDRPKSRGSSRVSEPQKQVVGDLVMGDMDDLESEVNNVYIAPKVTTNSSSHKLNLNKLEGKPIDTKTAAGLKILVHGSATVGFSDEWFYQSFSFCDMPGLQYGVVQKKGGPCGILASVQACMLQEMLFGEQKLPHNKCLDPSRSERTLFLALALSRIFWRAGEGRKAVVTISSGRPHVLSTSKFKHDNLTETLMLYTFTKYDELLGFMKQSVSQFEMDGNSGVILVLYSALLSRSLDRVRGDLDEPEGKLMAAHGYCTLEMANLLLTGRAVANVFNDVIELDSGTDQVTILKGIHTRSDIGFLSLFEHYKSCQVGTYYKTPKYPIWVVCSESHFSVLFGTKRELMSDWKAERRFDLHYFDGLARQQEPIKLTVDTSNRFYKPPCEEELVPPLEHCIRTKWSDAEIDWNGYEPIL